MYLKEHKITIMSLVQELIISSYIILGQKEVSGLDVVLYTQCYVTIKLFQLAELRK